MMVNKHISAFIFDRERNVTLSLAGYLGKNAWNVIACE